MNSDETRYYIATVFKTFVNISSNAVKHGSDKCQSPSILLSCMMVIIGYTWSPTHVSPEAHGMQSDPTVREVSAKAN